MKNLKTFNELYRSTYFSAGHKLTKKQPNRGNRLLNYAEDKGLYKNFFIPDYKFDIHVGFTLDGAEMGQSEEELKTDTIIQEVTVEDHFERHDANKIALPLNLVKTNHPRWYLTINIEIDNDKVNIYIFDERNKFCNRRSAIKFMELLHKFYILHNPNRMSRIMSKINGDSDISGVSELTYNDVDGDNFWGFLHENDYDWEKFKNKVNINDLWDYYE